MTGKSENEAHTLTVSGVPTYFPKKPFPSQIALMNKVMKALNGHENALLESPTGTGKTLALLCSTLSWQMHHYQSQLRKRKEIEEAEKVRENAERNETLNRKLQEEKAVSRKSESKYFCKSKTKLKVAESDSSDDDDDFVQNRKHKVLKKQEKEKKIEEERKGGNKLETKRVLEKNQENRPDIFVDKIFFVSRTHSQLVQALKELKECPQEITSGRNIHSKSLKATLLGSRQQFCVNSAVTKYKKFSSSSARDEECKRLLNDPSGCKCPYYKIGQHRLKREASSKGIWDIEDLNKMGKKTKGCPYFVARDLVKSSHIIFAPYTYLMNPSIRKSMGMDTFLKGSIVIFDEAHNVEDVVRGSASFEYSVDTLEETVAQLVQVCRLGDQNMHNDYSRLHMFISSLLFWCKRVLSRGSDPKVWTGPLFLEILSDQCELTPETLTVLRDCLKKAREAAKRDGEDGDENQSDIENLSSQSQTQNGLSVLSTFCEQIIDSIFTTLEYMYKEDRRYANDFQAAIIKSGENKPKLVVWCLRGAVCFADFADKTRSVILSSGTLSPLSSFSEELGTQFKQTLEASHVLDVKKHLWVGAVSHGIGGNCLDSTFRNINSSQYQDELGRTILSYLKEIPDGALVFFPSYSVLAKCTSRWKLSGLWKQILRAKGEVLVEGKDVTDNQRNMDRSMKKYLSSVEAGKGALFLCVFRGRLSEGIDFRDRAARAVFITGIPYPPLMDLKVKLKREYQDKNSQALNGNCWYSQQAWRALNQALGRVIRHRNDFGAIILLDQRFMKNQSGQNLSKWMRKSRITFETTSLSIRSLKLFFDTHQELSPPLTASTTSKKSKNNNNKSDVFSAFRGNASVRDSSFKSYEQRKRPLVQKNSDTETNKKNKSDIFKQFRMFSTENKENV